MDHLHERNDTILVNVTLAPRRILQLCESSSNLVSEIFILRRKGFDLGRPVFHEPIELRLEPVVLRRICTLNKRRVAEPTTEPPPPAFRLNTVNSNSLAAATSFEVAAVPAYASKWLLVFALSQNSVLTVGLLQAGNMQRSSVNVFESGRILWRRWRVNAGRVVRIHERYGLRERRMNGFNARC